MSVGGKAVSVENYTMVTEPDGALRAEAEISISGSKQKTTTALSKGRFVSFLAQSGETKLISAAFDSPGVKLQIAGQVERQLTTKATVILENAVWHHFIFLFNQYDAQKGGRQSFTAFLPSKAMDFDMQVERTATPAFEIGGKQVATERYHLVSSSGLILDVWTDLQRILLLIMIEAQGVKVIRQGSEQLSEAASKPVVAEGHLSEEVTFRNGDVSLAGALTIPEAATNATRRRCSSAAQGHRIGTAIPAFSASTS
jgi:hypothetical protein